MSEAEPDEEKPFVPTKRSARYRKSDTRRWHYGVFFMLFACFSAAWYDEVHARPWLWLVIPPASFGLGCLLGQLYFTIYMLEYGVRPYEHRDKRGWSHRARDAKSGRSDE